ncbi:MAG TPA: hypothetical protein VFP67_02795 [Acidimicrobiia bacterium]|nr:hypothetical protein [Acidimicrobiia bacterium]
MTTQETAHAADTTPHQVLSRLAGLAMTATVVFVILGNEPVVQDFFDQSLNEEQRLQILLDAGDEWDRANTMWAIAGIMTAVGFALWAVAIHLGRADRTAKRVATVGAISATLGAVAWVYVCVWRAAGPPAEVAAGVSGLVLLAWALLVMVAVGMVGWTLRRAEMRLRGWVLIVIGVLFVPIGTILPATVVFPVALTGLILLLTPSRQWESRLTITRTDPPSSI